MDKLNHQMNTVLIGQSYFLIDEILSHLICTDRDYSANLVVFPGKRPSHFLRKVIADREKRSFIPPPILSMDEFIDFYYEKILDIQKRKLETIDGVSILFKLG